MDDVASDSQKETIMTDTAELLAFLFIIAMFLGLELISKVPATLHTPLMSGSNAISGITLIGAIAVAGLADASPVTETIAIAAVAFAAINVVGGYLVTDRMLRMFKSRTSSRK